MSVHAKVKLTKTVDDLDKADDWFREVFELLEKKTTCTIRARSSNSEEPIELVKD